jgi:transposase-like protein
MDEVVLTIGGKKHSLWRAVDQEGKVRDILVQSRRVLQKLPKDSLTAQTAEVCATHDHS